MSSVARLKRSWALVHPKVLEVWEHLCTVANRRENFGALRALTEERVAQGLPVVPYVGIWLTDLVYIHDAMPSLHDGKINMLKLKANARILEMVVGCQAELYQFHPVPEIQSLMLETEIMESEELYQLSLEIERKPSAAALGQLKRSGEV
jgi:hypothetical protein